jgi:hypothetical protein
VNFESPKVSSLDTGAVRSRGRSPARAAAAAAGPAGWPAEAAFSVFMERAGADDGRGGGGRGGGGGGGGGEATLVLHVYEAGRAPGLTPAGFAGAAHGGPVAALLRVAGGAVDGVWVAAGGPAGRGREGLRAWGGWAAVEAVARESVGGRVGYWLNDYGDCEDRLGLGLATTSRAEAWEDE